MIDKFRQCGRNFLNAAIPLLEQQRGEARIDLYQPVVDEVLGGLFARVFRYCQTFLVDYHFWAVDVGQIILRTMLESVFYMKFLSGQNQVEIYLAFQRYGIGQEKLYKLQLRKLAEEGKIEKSPELDQFINSDSDEEIPDELVNVLLKNFADVRKVADDAGMKQEYVLQYQPESIVVHGHWPALRAYHLSQCEEPLHRLHYQPFFGLPPLDERLRIRALFLFERAYEIWRSRYGLEDALAALIGQYLACGDANLDEPSHESKSTAESTSSETT